METCSASLAIYEWNSPIIGECPTQWSVTRNFDVFYDLGMANNGWVNNSDADQIKHQSSASLAFLWGIHQRPVNSPHKGPVTRKMFPFYDVIMITEYLAVSYDWSAPRIIVSIGSGLRGQIIFSISLPGKYFTKIHENDKGEIVWKLVLFYLSLRFQFIDFMMRRCTH